MLAIVTDVHYRMSLALIRDLGQAGVTVITCEREAYRNDPASPPLGAFSKYTHRHVWLPEKDFIEALAALCREAGEEGGSLPALLPVGAATLREVSESREMLEKVCGLCVPTPEQLELFNDKEAVCRLAEELEIPRPKSFSRQTNETPEQFFSRVSLPCVVKPRCGERLGLTAKDRYTAAKTEDDLKAAFLHFSSLAGEEPIVQEFLPGAGLGCSILAENGEVLASICHRRIREFPITGGPSSCCVSVCRPDLLDFASRMAARTKYTGLAMFEFKEDSGGNPRLLEINPRIWGTFPLTRVSKSGIPLLWCETAFRRGNGGKQLPSGGNPVKKKMIFALSDIMAGIGYFKGGQPGKALGVLGDLLNPAVRDGLFEWRDPRPGVSYIRALFAKEGRR